MKKRSRSPLWFLLSLFWVNILFYAIQRYIKPLWALLLVTVALSVVGYVLAANKIQLPLMMDTSLVALPYFVLGWGINRLGVLQPSRWDKWGLVALIIALIPIYLFSDFLNLHYQVLPQYWKLYFFPFLANCSTLYPGAGSFDIFKSLANLSMQLPIALSIVSPKILYLPSL